MTSGLSLRDVEVDYGLGPVLGPLSLQIESSQTVALVGPSGCGKSTLLRLLAGLEQPTRGSVERQVGRAETSLVFQAPTLAPWLDAADNVALPLRLTGTPAAEARKRAEVALEEVGLGHALQRRPARLSGGMAMRVSLARARVTQPRLLLLDEPFAALDEVTRRLLADDVLKLWDAQRPTLIFVTHSVEEAVYMAERIIVLGRGPGRIIADRTTGPCGPRPLAHRASAAFRNEVEILSQDLMRAMT